MQFSKMSKIGWAALVIGMALSATVLFVASETGAQQRGIAQQRAMLNRTWTCHAEIQLQGGTYPPYVPASWQMSGPITMDRENACRNYLLSHWIGNAAIWSLLNLPASAQSAICAAGNGVFRIDYGFDERRKGWSVTQPLTAPACNCPMSCPAGFNMDYTGRRCDRALCGNGNINHPNQNFIDANNNGVFIWSGTLYQMVPAVQSGGACTFR